MKRFLCAFVAVSAAVFAQLPNGEVAGAITIGVGINPDGPAGISGNTYTNVGEADTLSAGLAPFTCGFGHNSDVFFTFTAPNTASYSFGTCTPTGFTAGTHLDTVLQVLDNTGMTQIGCDDDACTSPANASQATVSLTALQTVIIRVATWSSAADGSFYLSVGEIFPPANDLCSAAEVVTDGVLINGTTVLATPSSPSPACASFSATNPDVWYSYTPTVSGTTRVTRSSGASRTAVYTGPCGAELLVAFGCSTAAENVFDVVAMQTYLIRVGVISTGAAFTLFIDPPVIPVTPSDSCLAAVPMSVGVSASTTVGATGTSPSPVCGSFSATTLDVWFSFTPSTGGLATLARSNDTEGISRMAVYTTADCLAFTAVGSTCGTSTSVGWTAIAFTTYYIRVGSNSAALAGPFRLNLSVVPFEPNDSCSGAIPIVNGANGPFSNVATLTGSDVGFGLPLACVGTHGRDLFFTYTAACNGSVDMNTCAAGTLSDTAIAAFDVWTCGVGGTPIACDDDTTCTFGNLRSAISFPTVAGTTYLVLVAGFNNGSGTFSINVTAHTAQKVDIGMGCPVTTTLTGDILPVMGQTGTITVTAQPNANGVLLFSNPNYAMAYTPFGACTIYVENPGMGILLPIFTDGAGLWSLTATFPTDPAFDCVGWDFQGLVIGAAGIEFTNALRLILGT